MKLDLSIYRLYGNANMDGSGRTIYVMNFILTTKIMEQQFQEIRVAQKASWNKFSSGWKKWDLELHAHMQPAADGIISLLKPSGAQIILDIAAGTGEPGLSIASMLTDGKVIITDLANEMLDIARKNALRNRGRQRC